LSRAAIPHTLVSQKLLLKLKAAVLPLKLKATVLELASTGVGFDDVVVVVGRVD
jgi:hypothetical protein